MWDTILAVVIVLLAAAWFAGKLRRAASGKGEGCGCGGSWACEQGCQGRGQSIQSPETVFTIAKKGISRAAKT